MTDTWLEELRSLQGNVFESMLGELWEAQGWDTTVTQSSKDKGIDLIAQRENPFNQKHVIQAKCYSENNKVGSREIQQYSSLYAQEENVDVVVVVTTSDFTKQARRLAKELNVKLLNGNDLLDLVDSIDGFDTLRRYTDVEDQEGKSPSPWKPIRQDIIEVYTRISNYPYYGWAKITNRLPKSSSTTHINYAYDDHQGDKYNTSHASVERMIQLPRDQVPKEYERDVENKLKENDFKPEANNSAQIQYMKRGEERNDEIESDVDVVIRIIRDVFNSQPSDVQELQVEEYPFSE